MEKPPKEKPGEKEHDIQDYMYGQAKATKEEREKAAREGRIEELDEKMNQVTSRVQYEESEKALRKLKRTIEKKD
ncbi:MAG: hypothetical protein ABSB00_02245 [Minisyncoccia bacterium]|jgi:ribosomal protein S21